MITITKESNPQMVRLLNACDTSNRTSVPMDSYDILDEYRDFLPEIEKELALLTDQAIKTMAEGGEDADRIADSEPMLSIAYNAMADYHGGAQD